MISEHFTFLPCPAKPKSTLDFEGCAEQRILESDQAINDRAGVIYFRLRNAKSAAAGRFVGGERAWLTFRRAVCESRADVFEGGSAAGIVFADCAADKNLAHLRDLRAFERRLRADFGARAPRVYVPGVFGSDDYGLRYKPRKLIYTGDGSSYVDHLRYLRYGGPRAIAVGIEQVCEPSCGGGGYHPVRARVTFWHLATCRSKVIYSMFKIDARGARRYGKVNPFMTDLRYMAACPAQTPTSERSIAP